MLRSEMPSRVGKGAVHCTDRPDGSKKPDRNTAIYQQTRRHNHSKTRETLICVCVCVCVRGLEEMSTERNTAGTTRGICLGSNPGPCSACSHCRDSRCIAAHWHQPRAGGRVGVATSKTGLCESADCAEIVAAAAPLGRPTAAAQTFTARW